MPTSAPSASAPSASAAGAPPPFGTLDPRTECGAVAGAYARSVEDPAARTCSRDADCQCVVATLTISGLVPMTAVNRRAAEQGSPLADRFTAGRCPMIDATGPAPAPCVAGCSSGQCRVKN